VTARIPIARGRAKRFSSTGIYPACSAQNVVVRQLSPCRRSTQDRFLSVHTHAKLANYSNSVDFHPHMALQTQREIDLILFPWRTIRKRANCDVVFVTMPQCLQRRYVCAGQILARPRRGQCPLRFALAVYLMLPISKTPATPPISAASLGPVKVCAGLRTFPSAAYLTRRILAEADRNGSRNRLPRDRTGEPMSGRRCE